MKYKYSQRINYIRFLLDVSCENCTHMAVVAEKNLSKVCYVQRDIVGVDLVCIMVLIMEFAILKGFMRIKMQL